MEENLANHSRMELETALHDSSGALQATLATQLHGIDGEWGLVSVGEEDPEARIWVVNARVGFPSSCQA